MNDILIKLDNLIKVAEENKAENKKALLEDARVCLQESNISGVLSILNLVDEDELAKEIENSIIK